MANITLSEYRGKALFITVDADPSAGAGTVAPIGTTALLEGGGVFNKTGAGNTAWTSLGGGIVINEGAATKLFNYYNFI